MDWFIKNFFRLEGADSADCYFKPEHIIVSTIITLLFISFLHIECFIPFFEVTWRHIGS